MERVKPSSGLCVSRRVLYLLLVIMLYYWSPNSMINHKSITYLPLCLLMVLLSVFCIIFRRRKEDRGASHPPAPHL